MNSLLHSWQFFILINILADVVFVQCYKLAVRNAKDHNAATILIESISGASALLFVPFFSWQFTFAPIVLVLFFLSTFFGAINDRLKTTARKFLPASEAAILNQLTTVIIILIGFVVLRQPFILSKVIGAVCILGANFFLLYERGSLRVNTYTALFVTACISLAIAMSLDINLSAHYNLPFYIASVYFMSAIYIYLGSRPKVSIIVREFRPKERLFFLLTGFSWAISFLAVVRAAQLGPYVVVLPLGTLSVLLNVLAATSVHKETKHIGRKLLAALAVIGGIILTVIH